MTHYDIRGAWAAKMGGHSLCAPNLFIVQSPQMLLQLPLTFTFVFGFNAVLSPLRPTDMGHLWPTHPPPNIGHSTSRRITMAGRGEGHIPLFMPMTRSVLSGPGERVLFSPPWRRPPLKRLRHFCSSGVLSSCGSGTE